jgi:predicted enzyme related to lactoylglutathione lyase
MAEVKEGTFCWSELATTDVGAAKAFYARIFPWQHEEVPMPQGGAYTMVLVGKDRVAGIFKIGPEMKGVPPHWMPYVATRDCDATARRAQKLGGKLMKEPFDVMEMGRMAVLQDPTGAHLALWQAKQPGDRAPTEPVGAPCWFELRTNDTARAKAFYTELFGWSAKEDTGEYAYTEFALPGEHFGGMMKLSPEWGPVPPHWGIYFNHPSCEQACKDAAAAGGRVMVPTMPIPNVGKFAILADPQGATFAVFHR